jgi:hypothetical protein
VGVGGIQTPSVLKDVSLTSTASNLYCSASGGLLGTSSNSS